MAVFNVHDVKTPFSKLMRRVEQGEEVCVARDGVVIARIVPERARRRVVLGRDEGKGASHDDFDAPSPEFAAYLL